MSSLSPANLNNALTGVRGVLQADGYDLDLNVADGRVRAEVIAGPDACKDCLVPKEIFTMMMANTLTQAGVAVDADSIEVIYPRDHEGSASI
jgi:hypothetical protein